MAWGVGGPGRPQRAPKLGGRRTWRVEPRVPVLPPPNLPHSGLQAPRSHPAPPRLVRRGGVRKPRARGARVSRGLLCLRCLGASPPGVGLSCGRESQRFRGGDGPADLRGAEASPPIGARPAPDPAGPRNLIPRCPGARLRSLAGAAPAAATLFRVAFFRQNSLGWVSSWSGVNFLGALSFELRPVFSALGLASAGAVAARGLPWQARLAPATGHSCGREMPFVGSPRPQTKQRALSVGEPG